MNELEHFSRAICQGREPRLYPDRSIDILTSVGSLDESDTTARGDIEIW